MLMRVRALRPEGAGHPQARTCAACTVRDDALFGALDATALEHIHAHIAAPEVPTDERIYARGQTGGAVYTVRAGIVRFERVSEGGRRRIVRLAGRGDLIGLEALLRQPFADDAVACTPVALCRIPPLLLEELGRAEAALPLALMRRWQQALEQAGAWAADLSAGPALRRVLKLLTRLERHAEADGRIWLPRRDEMADMLDLTVETASRMVSRLRREGILTLLPPRHARLDSDALARALAALDA